VGIELISAPNSICNHVIRILNLDILYYTIIYMTCQSSKSINLPWNHFITTLALYCTGSYNIIITCGQLFHFLSNFTCYALVIRRGFLHFRSKPTATYNSEYIELLWIFFYRSSFSLFFGRKINILCSQLNNTNIMALYYTPLERNSYRYYRYLYFYLPT